jgi:Ca2+-binding EF-hand superfamily protein
MHPTRRSLCATTIALMVLGSLLAACGGSSRDASPPPPPTPVSPNGEPLVSGGPHTACEAALGQWFDAADTNHDGSLDPAEFKADARRWFDAMDLNRDGSVTPDELTTLRLKLMPYEPPPRQERKRESSNMMSWFSERPRRNVNDRPDPVMSADVNLDNRVTWEEFDAQAARTFVTLDANRDGRVSKDEVLVACRPR